MCVVVRKCIKARNIAVCVWVNVTCSEKHFECSVKVQEYTSPFTTALAWQLQAPCSAHVQTISDLAVFVYKKKPLWDNRLQDDKCDNFSSKPTETLFCWLKQQDSICACYTEHPLAMQRFFFHHLDLQCCSSIKTFCKVVSHCNEYFYYACTFNSLCMCVCTKSQEAHQVNPMHPVTQLQNTPALTSGIWGTSTTWRPCCCFGTCGKMDTF